MNTPSARREAAIYASATVLLIVLGIFYRSYVLNWVAGPAIVVVTVAGLDRLTSRRGRRSP